MGGAKKVVKKATGAVSKLPGGKHLVKTTELFSPALRLAQGKNLVGRDLAATLGMGGPAIAAGGASSMAMPGEAPEFESLRDEAGMLKEQYRLDPTKSAAFAEMQKQAMAAPGSSPWAKMQLEKQALEEQMGREGAGRAAQTAAAQAQGQLLRTGGLSSGARTRLAMQAQKDASRAQQDVARQGMLARLGIGESDIGRQAELLKGVGATELTTQEQNLANLGKDIAAKREFDLAKYQQQMATFGAGKTADAQVAAAKRSSKK